MAIKNNRCKIVALLFIGAALLQTSCSPNTGTGPTSTPAFTSANEELKKTLLSTLEQAKSKVGEGVFDVEARGKEVVEAEADSGADAARKKFQDILLDSYKALNETSDMLNKENTDEKFHEARAFRIALGLTLEVKVLADMVHEIVGNDELLKKGFGTTSEGDGGSKDILMFFLPFSSQILKELQGFLQETIDAIKTDQESEKKKIEILDKKASMYSKSMGLLGGTVTGLKAIISIEPSPQLSGSS